MPLAKKIIEDKLNDAFPTASYKLEDTAGDENHYALEIVSDAFDGKRSVARHQMIYKALGAVVGHELHALSITALTPSEHSQK